MKFKLNKTQLNYALELAKQRHDAKHASFRNKDVARFMNEKKEELSDEFRVDKQYMAHFLGVIGELGYALATDQKVDEEIYSVRDSGQDFDGVEVDQEATGMLSIEPFEEPIDARTDARRRVVIEVIEALPEPVHQRRVRALHERRGRETSISQDLRERCDFIRESRVRPEAGLVRFRCVARAGCAMDRRVE